MSGPLPLTRMGDSPVMVYVSIVLLWRSTKLGPNLVSWQNKNLKIFYKKNPILGAWVNKNIDITHKCRQEIKLNLHDHNKFILDILFETINSVNQLHLH